MKTLFFGHIIIVTVLVNSKQVLFEFELMEAEFHNHYHAYALPLPPTSSCQKYLIYQVDLANFHPYGL